MIPEEWSPLWISIATSAAATAAAFVLGMAAAAGMRRYRGPGRGILDGVLTLPLVLPPTVVGFFLLLLLGRRSGVGRLLEQFGMRIAFSWPATVIAATVVAFPLMYRAALGAFEQVNANLLGAARTLGASEWRTFREVLLPLARPGVLAGLVLTFARALGEFGATLMLAGNIPGRTQTMPVAIFFAAESGDLGRALGWVTAIVLLSLGSIAALNYWTPGTMGRRGSEGRGEGWRAQPQVVAHAARPAKRAGGSLVVDVGKTFPGFELAATFAAAEEPLGLLGASGSGKSMTLRCIAGMERPDRGRVVLNGRVLFDAEKGIDVPPAERRVGMVFQDYALFPHLTVAENIAFGARQKEPVERWAKMLQIDGLLANFPGELSGGQRQRVALARALAMEPEALLLDEPLSALDPHLRRQTGEQLREALERYGGVTIFVTHDRDEAFRFCGDLAVLADGKTAAAGPKREVFDRPRTLAVARLTGCKNLARMKRLSEGEVEVDGWKCRLQTAERVPESANHVGIRAHDLRLRAQTDGANVFACWMVDAIESPFETTVYLRLHAPPAEGEAAHLEAEVAREQWVELRDRPQPWQVALDARKLLFLEG